MLPNRGFDPIFRRNLGYKKTYGLFGWGDFMRNERKGLWFLKKLLIWIEHFHEKLREKYNIYGPFPFLASISFPLLSHHPDGVLVLEMLIYTNSVTTTRVHEQKRKRKFKIISNY